MGNCFLYKRGMGSAGASEVVYTAMGKLLTFKATDKPLKGLRIFGKTTQNGTPTPDAPVSLESVGDGGSVGVTVCGKNLLRGFAGTEANPYFITAKKDDNGVVLNGTTAFMEVGKPYTVSIYTDGIWGNAVGSDTVEWFLLKDGKYYNSIGATKNGKRLSKTFFIEVTGDYTLRLDVNKNGVTHSFWNAQVEEGTQATEFEPYKGQTLTLSTPNGIPGIPVASGGNHTDSTGQQWVCDEVDFARGKYIKRINNIVFTGAENWGMDSGGIWTGLRGGNSFFVDLIETSHSVLNIPVMCNTHNSVLRASFDLWNENSVCIASGGKQIEFIRTPYTSIADWKSWVINQYNNNTPVTVQYILKEPAETDLTAEQLAACAALHTNYPNTTIFNDAGAWMEVKYL